MTDRKSRSGSLLLLNKAHVAWNSQKQSCVATSTTKSEYVATSSTTKDVIWMQRLLANLGFIQLHPTRLFSDNQSTIWLVHNRNFIAEPSTLISSIISFVNISVYKILTCATSRPLISLQICSPKHFLLTAFVCCEILLVFIAYQPFCYGGFSIHVL
jgi:hypothetical protein